MIYDCPRCGRPDPSITSCAVWRGCKYCRFGYKAALLSRGDPKLWKELIREDLLELEIERLCDIDEE